MLIKDAMCRDVKIIRPDTPIAVAARLMRDCDCGYLTVGEDDRLKGAVTDRDIVVRGLAEGLNPDAPVSDVMTDRIV
jgi:CBS domain-containing protein